jgi:hypothetical protein
MSVETSSALVVFLVHSTVTDRGAGAVLGCDAEPP